METNKNLCGIMVEYIQGENGVIIPDDGYLSELKKLCVKYKVLLICDEIQTGLGRTGKLMSYEWDNVKPDIVCMGKALSGGTMAVSCVLANDDIMLLIKPGEHGSTYGGNPLGMAVARTSIEVIIEEGMVENSLKMGDILHD
jgi:ornithine--oxo-acid transaminase